MNFSMEELPQYVVAKEDPYAAEHEAIQRWVRDSIKEIKQTDSNTKVELKHLPSGQALLAVTPQQACRLVRAAVMQLRYWDDFIIKHIGSENGSSGRIDTAFFATYQLAAKWFLTREVLAALMRRALPFEKDDLLELLAWCNSRPTLVMVPLGVIVRALERYVNNKGLDDTLRHAIQRFHGNLQASGRKDDKHWCTTLGHLCHTEIAEIIETQEKRRDTRPLTPAAAGQPAVMNQLKRYLGLLAEEPAPFELIDPDRFALRDDSPLR